MALHTTGSIPNTTLYNAKHWDGFHTDAEKKYAQASFLDKVFKKVNSDLMFYREKSQPGVSAFTQIAEHALHPEETIFPGHTVEIQIKEFGKVFSASKLVLDKTPNRYNIWRKYAFMFRKAYNETQAIEGASKINNIYTTTGADGEYIIDNDHPLDGSSDTWSNELSGNGSLSVTNLESALINMWYPPNQRDLTLEIVPAVLLVGKELAPLAWKIVEKGLMPLTSDNTKNVMMDKMPLEVVVCPWKTSSTAWELVQKVDEYTPHPLLFWDDKPLDTYVTILDERSKGEEYHGYGRCVAGYGADSRGIYGSDGTGS